MHWDERAACRGLEQEPFFPEDRDDPQGCANAKAVCASCPVTRECLHEALAHHINYGVWGGYSARQRRRMRSHGMSHA